MKLAFYRFAALRAGLKNAGTFRPTEAYEQAGEQSGLS